MIPAPSAAPPREVCLTRNLALVWVWAWVRLIYCLLSCCWHPPVPRHSYIHGHILLSVGFGGLHTTADSPTGIKSQSQSYLTTFGQSASLSWCQATIGEQWHIFLLFFLLESFFRQLRVCYYGAPSLTRGRISNLQLLLCLARAVFLGSQFRGTHDQILVTQMWDSSPPGGPGSCINFPQLYPQALRYLYVSYLNFLIHTHRTLTETQVNVMLRQTISQYVVVSSSLWNPWPDVILCLNVAVLSLLAPSLTRGRVYLLSVTFISV
jgi:hypothetical protein